MKSFEVGDIVYVTSIQGQWRIDQLLSLEKRRWRLHAWDKEARRYVEKNDDVQKYGLFAVAWQMELVVFSDMISAAVERRRMRAGSMVVAAELDAMKLRGSTVTP